MFLKSEKICPIQLVKEEEIVPTEDSYEDHVAELSVEMIRAISSLKFGTDMDEDELRFLFKEFGKIKGVNINVRKNRRTKENIRNGYVNYVLDIEATKAFDTMNQTLSSVMKQLYDYQNPLIHQLKHEYFPY